MNNFGEPKARFRIRSITEYGFPTAALMRSMRSLLL
jgi:hypothetical protein